MKLSVPRSKLNCSSTYESLGIKTHTWVELKPYFPDPFVIEVIAKDPNERMDVLEMYVMPLSNEESSELIKDMAEMSEKEIKAFKKSLRQRDSKMLNKFLKKLSES